MKQFRLAVFSIFALAAIVVHLRGYAHAGTGVGVDRKIESNVNNQMKSLGNSGWSVSASPFSSASVEWRDLAAKAVAQAGKMKEVNGRMCGLMGYTANQEVCFFYQVADLQGDRVVHIFSARDEGGYYQTFFYVKSLDTGESMVYRATSAGDLDEAIYVGAHPGIHAVEKTEAAGGFEKERVYWSNYFARSASR